MAQTPTSSIEAEHAKAWNKVKDNYDELFRMFDELNGTKPSQPAVPTSEEVFEAQAFKALDEAFPPPLAPVLKKARKAPAPKASNRRHEKA